MFHPSLPWIAGRNILFMSLLQQLALRASLILSVFATGFPTICASASEQDSDSLAVQALAGLEVLGNATRREVSATVPVYSLSSELMEIRGVTDMADALHRLPGVNLRDYGGAGGLKTVSVRGLGANHTAVLVDGLPVTDNQNGFVDMSRFAVENLENLSLTIGDDSDIFTSATAAASAATLRLSSATPSSNPRAPYDIRLRVRGGSFGTISPYVRASRRFGDGWNAAVSADYRHASNDYPFRIVNGSTVTEGRRLNSLMNAGRADATFGRTGDDGSEFSARVQYNHDYRQLPGAVTLYNPESNERLLERNFFGQARWRSAGGGVLRWQAAAKFSFDASRYRDRGASYPGGELDDRYIQRQAYATASMLYRPDSRWAVDVSADYSFSNLSSNRRQPQPRRHSVLVMGAATFRSGRVLAGARLIGSFYSNSARGGDAGRDVSRLSPSANVSVRLLADRLLFLRLSYKNIFRMPTFADLYYGTTGSPTLRPETTDQFNIGLTWQAGRGRRFPLVALTADVYCNRVKDRIVAIPKNMFIWSMVNVGRVRSLGVDFTADISYAIDRRQNLLFAANYSYQRVQPRTSPSDPDYNKQVAYTPEHSGSASLTWENPWVCAVVHVTAVSERYGTNSNLPMSRIGGYADCGAGVFRNFSIGRCRLKARLDVTNILNTRYEVISRYPMPGRAWMAGLTFDI